MADFRYLALEVTISGDRQSGYTVQGSTADSGSRELPLVLPWGETELEELLGVMSDEAAGLRSGGTHQSRIDAEGFGAKLFDAVFHGGVRDLLRTSQARGDVDGVRVRLRLDAPSLADVPWEYLFDRENNRFMALSRATPVVRTFNLTTPVRSRTHTDELRVLVMVSGAGDVELETDEEFAALEAELAAESRVQLTRAPQATLESLIDELSQGDFHVFHFIGHGRYDDRASSGELLLEDAEGRPRPVSADEVAMHLADHSSLRLIVLNACEGARASVSDPTSGIAQSLFTGGVEAVVAMQFEITDAAALEFSTRVYRRLAAGDPIEKSVTEARKAIGGRGREWATPVLFMRSADGQLFGAPTASTEPVPEPEPETSPSQTDPPEPGIRSRLPLIAGAVLAVVIVGLVVAILANRGDDGPSEEAATPAQEPGTSEPGIGEPSSVRAWHQLGPGDCLVADFIDFSSNELIGCELAHGAQVYKLLELGGRINEWDPTELERLSDEGCGSGFDEALDHLEVTDDLDYDWVDPNEEEWQAGLRTVPCIVWSVSGSLTGDLLLPR